MPLLLAVCWGRFCKAGSNIITGLHHFFKSIKKKHYQTSLVDFPSEQLSFTLFLLFLFNKGINLESQQGNQSLALPALVIFLMM